MLIGPIGLYSWKVKTYYFNLNHVCILIIYFLNVLFFFLLIVTTPRISSHPATDFLCNCCWRTWCCYDFPKWKPYLVFKTNKSTKSSVYVSILFPDSGNPSVFIPSLYWQNTKTKHHLANSLPSKVIQFSTCSRKKWLRNFVSTNYFQDCDIYTLLFKSYIL